MYGGIAERVIRHWDAIFSSPNPLHEEICEWRGLEYPMPLGRPRRSANLQGNIEPSTEFEECLANARAYAGPHLHQLAAVLDYRPGAFDDRNGPAAALPRHLTTDCEVIVVDVGCAAGILGLFSDRAGFAGYVGIDTNPWMRLLAELVLETTFNSIAVQDGRSATPDFGPYGEFLPRTVYASHPGASEIVSIDADRVVASLTDRFDPGDEWAHHIRRIAQSGASAGRGGRPVTVVFVLNHILFQTSDIAALVNLVFDLGAELSGLEGVTSFMVSIEPGRLWKPDRFGVEGLDALVSSRPVDVSRIAVPGAGDILRGRQSQNDARVRVVRFR